MTTRIKISVAAAAGLVLAACNGTADAPDNGSAGSGIYENGAAAAGNRAAPAAATLRLAAGGLEPGLAFGMARDEAVAAVAKVLGPQTGSGHNDECGEGPLDFVSFGGLQLALQEGRFTGWSLNTAEPALRTAAGLGIGSPRSALGGIKVDEESSIGPEFDAGGVFGILDEKGEKVEFLWSGMACIFR